MTTNFDNFIKTLTESLLTEAPIGMDSPQETEEVLSKIVDNIMASRNTAGHWVKAFTSKKLSKKATESKTDDEIRSMVTDLVSDVIKKVLPEKDNTYNPDLTKEDLKPALKDAIKSVFEINSTYSDFLSARFANKELLGKVKDVIENGLSSDLEEVIEVTDEGGAELSDESDDEGDEEDKGEAVIDDEIETKSKENTSHNVTFMPEMEYYFNTLDELKSGTLSHDLRVKYERLDPLTGSVHKGKEFIKMFQRYNMTAKEVSDFVKAGILEPTEDFKDSGDTKGFDKSEEDFISDYVKSSMKDKQGSEFGQRFGGGSTEDIFG